jgi:hypothetical protein
MLAVWIGGVVMEFGRVAEGSPITWEFTGEVTFLRDETDLLGGAVEIGDPFFGSFTFESTTPDANPGDPRIGLYEDAILALSGYVADVPFTGVLGGTNFVELVNPSGIGSEHYLARLDADFAGQSLDFGLQLLGRDPGVFPGDLLPLFPPHLADLSTAEGFLVDGSETIPLSVSGTVVALVPEPATLVLVMVGTMMFSKRGRERSAEGAIRRALQSNRPRTAGARTAVAPEGDGTAEVKVTALGRISSATSLRAVSKEIEGDMLSGLVMTPFELQI